MHGQAGASSEVAHSLCYRKAQEKLAQKVMGGESAIMQKSPCTETWLSCPSLPLYYSLCFLAEAAVAEGLQRLESKVAVSLTMLSESQVCSGKAQDSQEKVIPTLW